MDEFTSAFLSRDKEELKDANSNISFTPFGVKAVDQSLPNNEPLEAANNEPESVKQWMREFAAGISKRDAIEIDKNQEMKEKAAKEMSDWAIWYKNNIVKSRQVNRAHEEELKSQREKTTLLSQSVATLNPNDTAIWERICELCDFSGNPSSTNSCGDSSRPAAVSPVRKDIARFRSLLLSLKNAPPKFCP